jgi:hypothetical protein
MRRNHHAQSNHNRRLADITVRQNLEEVLGRVAVRFGRLAEDRATAKGDFRHPEMLPERNPWPSRLP